MKRLLLIFGITAAVLAGCGGGGGGSSPPPAMGPSNPGAPVNGATTPPSTSSPGATPTPKPSGTATPTATPSGLAVSIGSPGALSANAINPLAPPPAPQATGGVAPVSATQNGAPLAAGTVLNGQIFSNDKSGNTCLVYVPNGSTSGTPCAYPAPGSTPQPVTIKAVGDGVAIQYNDAPMNPAAQITLSGTFPSASSQPANVAVPLTVAVGHTAPGAVEPWGGGIVYANNAIYFTQFSKTNPIGMVTYVNGTAGSSPTNLGSASLTNEPAGGLIMGPDGRLWGTEQNNSRVFAMTTSGVTTEYPISCPSGSSSGTTARANLLGPQTGITTDGTSVYVLCADVAHGNPANNVVVQLNPAGATTAACTGTGSFGSFANGAIYANGYIITAEGSGGAGGSGAGGANSGKWLAIPTAGNLASCSTQFVESVQLGSMTGDGNVVMSGSTLFSETDDASGSFAGAFNVAGTPNAPFADQSGLGGGLAQDQKLGSNWFFGTAQYTDLLAAKSFSAASAQSFTASVPLAAGGASANAGECEVSLNSGGGFGLIQLPDGKLAWPAATDGDEAGRNWICFANL
jgi:hypothetical protein